MELRFVVSVLEPAHVADDVARHRARADEILLDSTETSAFSAPNPLASNP